MIVLALDLSLTSTGYVLGEVCPTFGGPRIDAYGTIRPKPKQPLEDRLLYLYDELARLCLRYEPLQAVAERFTPSGRTMSGESIVKLAGPHAITHLALARADLLRPVILYLTNSHAKKVILGDGRADVGAVRVFVRRAFPQLPWPEKWASKKNKYDDIADAAIIWACYAVEHYRADLSKLRIPPQSL